MKFTKAQKFAAGIIAATALFLLYINYTYSLTVNWNTIFNDLLTEVIAGFVIMALTIFTYRYLYHGRSRK